MTQLALDLTPSLSPAAQRVVDYLIGSRPKGCDISAMFQAVLGTRVKDRTIEVDFIMFEGQRATCRVKWKPDRMRIVQDAAPARDIVFYWTEESWPRMDGVPFHWSGRKWERVSIEGTA